MLMLKKNVDWSNYYWLNEVATHTPQFISEIMDIVANNNASLQDVESEYGYQYAKVEKSRRNYEGDYKNEEEMLSDMTWAVRYIYTLNCRFVDQIENIVMNVTKKCERGVYSDNSIAIARERERIHHLHELHKLRLIKMRY